jgi:NADPH-dependent 2,4-dienoyl-CoA reductase/sulfur reductase-like enzyme
MFSHVVDVAVIGGGPAGLAAAVSTCEHGAKYVVVIDRNSWLGGILPQCIHDGFGVEETGSSMTGPEYAEMYIETAKKLGVTFMHETMVIGLNKNLELTAVSRKGLYKIKAKSIILAMGCREKTRWNVMIPGDRPSGIYTAGVAQGFINLYNIIPGSNVLVLGSGDVGLIMARRLKFEGANVLGVVEILPYASGLPRNVVQCLDDYDIPMYLNHTITNIEGRDRLRSVTIARVDRNMDVIDGSEKKIVCDTLLLSLGLIPENELSKGLGVEIDRLTGGPMVDQFYETSVPGVFACGNCLQVYDTVDVLAVGAKRAGFFAAENASKSKKKAIQKYIRINAGKDILFVVPQIIKKEGKIDFTLRVKKPQESVTLKIKAGEKEIYKKKLRYVNPANMIEITADIPDKIIKNTEHLEVTLDE